MTPEHNNDLLAREAADRRVLLRALGVAIVLHAALLAMALPQWAESTPETAAKQVYVIRQVRFQASPPRAASAPSQQHRRALRIPVPDPTPDDPEPILRELQALPDLDLPDLSDAVFSIPDAPGPMRVDGRIPLEVGGEVSAPVKVYGPSPPYTEEARLARVQGVVMLRTVIDSQGQIAAMEVIKGLPNGLTDSALATVREWRFEPARRGGEPVPVYYFLTISFRVL